MTGAKPLLCFRQSRSASGKSGQKPIYLILCTRSPSKTAPLAKTSTFRYSSPSHYYCKEAVLRIEGYGRGDKAAEPATGSHSLQHLWSQRARQCLDNVRIGHFKVALIGHTSAFGIAIDTVPDKASLKELCETRRTPCKSCRRRNPARTIVHQDLRKRPKIETVAHLNHNKGVTKTTNVALWSLIPVSFPSWTYRSIFSPLTSTSNQPAKCEVIDSVPEKLASDNS